MSKRIFFILPFLFINIAFASNNLPSFSKTVKRLMPTVVNVSTYQTVDQKNVENTIKDIIPKGSPFEEFFQEFFNQNIPNGKNRKRVITALGSGFIISKNGYIVTNAHVVDQASKINIKLYNDKIYQAKLIGLDKKSDIALLKIKVKTPLQAVEFGNSDKAEVGSWVIAVGNPFGLGGTVTAGIVSARGRHISDGSNNDFIQTDAAINQGNSGGPMFNIEGKLIGINTAIFSQTGGSIGIGFAIPIQTALPIIKQLKSTGKVIRGWLGVNIQLVSNEFADALGIKEPIGAYVVGVAENGAAKKAGILVDDLIIKFDGKKIKTMYQLPRIVSNTKIGKNVEVVVLRRKKSFLEKISLNVKIKKFSEKAYKKRSAPSKLKKKKFLGLELVELNNKLIKKYKLPKYSKGILITDIINTQRNILGIKIGDIITKVNQKSVHKIRDFSKLVKFYKKKGRKHILLHIERGGNDFIIAFPID